MWIKELEVTLRMDYNETFTILSRIIGYILYAIKNHWNSFIGDKSFDEWFDHIKSQEKDSITIAQNFANILNMPTYVDSSIKEDAKSEYKKHKDKEETQNE